MAMVASSNSFVLQKPNRLSQTHLLKNTTSHFFNGVLNLTTPRKPISITCSADRQFNFNAERATLPESVLEKAELELSNWSMSGINIMEMSHNEFLSIIKKAESDLRALLDIPSDYAVLFLKGGFTTQFAAIPLNLCKPKDPVDYIVTGLWGEKAFNEARKFCVPKLIWSGKSENYTKIPSFDGLDQNLHAKYLHICANETIHGVEFKNYPTQKNPNGVLIADMSSNFCSKPVDVSKFGVIYAGAQNNLGPSEVTIVIIKKDLIRHAQYETPETLNYKIHADNNSLYTCISNCYEIYKCGLVFEDLLAQGGLEKVEEKNMRKANILYNAIDESNGFYRCPVEESVRSLMNVPFTLEKSELEAVFLEEAAKENMVQLKGDWSVGGMRASIYNAMPLAGVEKLVAFMKYFQEKHA